MMQVKAAYRLLAIPALVAALAAGAVAQQPLWQREVQEKAQTFFVDHAHFRPFTDEHPGKQQIDIYYQVYQAGLEFLPEDDDWVARYEVDVKVTRDDRVVAEDSRESSIRVDSKERTESAYDFRTSQFTFYLEPEKYDVEVTLRDRVSHKVTTEDFEVELKEFDSSKPEMSDVEFVQAVHAASQSGQVFNKGELQLIPSVTRAFGGEEDSRLLYYHEVYRGTDEDESVIVETRLRHDNKGMIYRDTLHVNFKGPVERQLREISLTDFPPGKYEMEITLRGRRNKRIDRIREEFSVLWTENALVKFDWDKVVDQLRYIAQPNEIDPLEDVEGIEARQQAFNEFWRERDPTVGTPENEKKNLFYTRVQIANARFSRLGREGWRSDRGRILIRFGLPDEIDDQPYAPNSVPYQIWHYYTTGAYKRFTFVDENSDGDYRLQYPYDGLYQSPDF